MVAGGGDPPPPASLPSPAPVVEHDLSDLEQQEDTDRALAEQRILAATRSFGGSENLEHYRGSPLLLDVLDELEPSHELRLTLRCTLFAEGADGELALVPRSWEHQLPTRERVAQLVAAGELAPGWFVVAFRRGQQTAPNVRFKVAPPVLPMGGGRAQGEGEQLERAVRLVRQLQAPSLAAGAKAAADEHERLSRVEQQLVALAQGLERLESTLGEIVGQQAAGGTGGGGVLSAVVDAVLSRLNKTGPAEADAAPKSLPARPASLGEIAR